MHPSVAGTAPRSHVTARLTGLFYLGLGITGMLGFLVIRPSLFVPDDAAATMTRLLTHEGRARVGVALEMGIVGTQALAALWFFRLFRPVDDFAAAAIGALGFMNAVAVLGSAACLATTLQVARSPLIASGADVQLLYLLSENFWRVGNLFFGLWLIPMGWCALRSRRMPRLLGWTLIAGGAGYVLMGLVGVLAPGAGLVAELLVVPATIGEFWMIGYLLVKGLGNEPP